MESAQRAAHAGKEPIMSRVRLALLLLAITALLAFTPLFAIPPDDDFILCTCKFCRENPDVDCQISPSGYTILCEDWARTHC
jgi:hypothetical protein